MATSPKSRAKAATAKVQDATPETVPVADNQTVPPPEAEAQAVAPPAPHTAFDLAVAFVLRDEIEGGYVNDPRDPGGETNFGISKRSYPKLNIAQLTRDEAIAIYKRDFWDTVSGDDLPIEVATCVFDCAINQGVGVAKMLLQKALGVTADGIIGPVTLKAATEADAFDLVVEFLSWRLRRYAFTGNAATYMRGWSKRVLLLQSFVFTLKD